MSCSPLIGSLPLSQIAIVESRIFRMPCRHCLSVVIIESQLRLLHMLRELIVYPDYRVTTVPVAFVTKACCVVVAMMAAYTLTLDTIELVLAWIVVCRSSPKVTLCATFVNNFV
jgi:NhaP-type Na+/H+ and K+/H+ antiporter